MNEAPNDPTTSVLSDQSRSLLQTAARPRAMSVAERKVAAQSIAKIAATPAAVAGGYSLAKIALASVATIATVGAAATLARSRPQEPPAQTTITQTPSTRPATSAASRAIDPLSAPQPTQGERPASALRAQPAQATAAPPAAALAQATQPVIARAASAAAPTAPPAMLATGPTATRPALARRSPTPQPATSAPVLAQPSTPTIAQTSSGSTALPAATGSGSHSLSGGVYNEPPEQRETTALEQVFSVVGNDPRRAMAMLEAFDREFPRSRLRDEREFLGVLVLDRLGRRDEARTRARSMLERAPTSMFAPRLRRLLEQAP